MLKDVLWDNVSKLMKHHFGKENLNRLSEECGIGLATAQRLKQRQTSVGIDIIEKIAERFALQPWQILVPGFDATNTPTLLPVSPQERQLYERLRAVVKDLPTS